MICPAVALPSSSLRRRHFLGLRLDPREQVGLADDPLALAALDRERADDVILPRRPAWRAKADIDEIEISRGSAGEGDFATVITAVEALRLAEHARVHAEGNVAKLPVQGIGLAGHDLACEVQFLVLSGPAIGGL